MEASIPEIHSGLHLGRALFFEFIGTALMVYAYNYTAASYMGRGFAYFIGWMLAVSISGAHFNPAVTFGVYLAEGKYIRQLGRLILYMLIQFAGGFFGIFFTWLVLKQPVMGYLLWPHVNDPDVVFWYFSPVGNIYYAKIVFLEILNTFTFVLCYLLIIYKPSLRTVDEIIKGLGAAIVLWICYFLCAGSGACLNPALGLAQTAYQVGFLNGSNLNGNGFASLIWVYIVMPFVGAVFGALFFRMHIHLDNKALEPRGAGNVPRAVPA